MATSLATISNTTLVALALALTPVPLAISATAAGDGQASVPRPLVETTKVNVVNVDVEVRDRDGNPVAGLTREDFTLYEDGKQQELTNFYAVDRTRVRSGRSERWQSIGARSPFRRRMIVLIDNNTLGKIDRDRALDRIEEFLDEKFDGTYEWAVITVGTGVQVLQPLTSNKIEVRAALDQIRNGATFKDVYKGERSFLQDPIRIQMAQREQASRRPLSEAMPATRADSLTAGLQFESQVSAYKNLQATIKTAQAMIEAFHAYGNLDGKKIMLMVTGGIQLKPGYGFQSSAQVARSGPSRGTPEPELQNPQLRSLKEDLENTLSAVGREANAAGFAIYPIKASGVTLDTPELDVENQRNSAMINSAAFTSGAEVDDSDSAQLTLAEDTGGLYVASNHMLNAIETVDRDSASYYSLGYSPIHSEDGKYHKIRVTVDRPGVAVRARKGYVDLSDEQRLVRYLSSPLTFPKMRGSLPVSLTVRHRGQDGQMLALAQVPIAKLQLFERGKDLVGRVYAYLAVYNVQGRLLHLYRRYQDLNFPADMKQEALSQDLKYGLVFDLDGKGDYTVTMTLRDELSNEIGTAIAHVRIGA